MELPRHGRSADFARWFGPVSDWLAGVAFPHETIGRCLAASRADQTARLVAQFWIVPIFLTIMIDGVALHAYGIDIASDYVFSSLYAILTLTKPFIEAVVLFLVLRALRAETSPAVVFSCYTVMVLYLPIFSWLHIPSLIANYSLLTYLKSLNLTFVETINYALSHSKETAEHISQPIPVVARYVGYVSSAIYLLAATLLAEYLHRVLRTSRAKAYGATVIATTLNLLPFAGVVLTQLLLVYAYLKSGVTG